MSEDLRRLAEQLVAGNILAEDSAYRVDKNIIALAADYLRSLDRLKRIKQRAEVVTTDEQFDAVLTEIVHLAALSPQEPRE